MDFGEAGAESCALLPKDHIIYHFSIDQVVVGGEINDLWLLIMNWASVVVELALPLLLSLPHFQGQICQQML